LVVLEEKKTVPGHDLTMLPASHNQKENLSKMRGSARFTKSGRASTGSKNWLSKKGGANRRGKKKN